MTTENQIKFLRDYMFLLDTTPETDKQEALRRMYMSFCLDHDFELSSDPIKVYSDLLEQLESIDLLECNSSYPSSIVGDGKSTNRFFVTVSPTYLQESEEEGCWEYETFKGSEANDFVSYGPFASYEEAEVLMENTTLDPDLLIGSVCIEDRMTGTVKERTLHKTVKTVVEYVL